MWRKTYIYQRSYSGFSIQQVPWFEPVSETPIKIKYRAARLRLHAPYYASNFVPITTETITLDKWLPSLPVPPRKNWTTWMANAVVGDPQSFNVPGVNPDVTIEKYNFYPTYPRFRNRVFHLVAATEATAFDPKPLPPSGGITATITIKSSQGLI